ncbi:DUF2225 domain-containing protein [Tepidibacter formicigenes]|uniref:DUF2225 domain-containing protein n=1 Tax=Tepidibacter formicigenes DSM 15518 TaxID=1123349 RepID=A0A1M6N3Z3_9FIRM|nr:DUF2225 domain-containing protein [Tepidibacter formicigenes]SHJ90376.1 hypothetical protein SAMN02744037_01147 [Tepidibacter formicigenes DSM 15518]
MDRELYDKKVKCPICINEFTTKKVKTSALRTLKRDTDFCVHYKTVNPYFYSIWICPKCGYAATESKFNLIKKEQHIVIREKVTSIWKERDYGLKRDIDTAIESYKLALYEGNILNWKNSYIGELCLKLSWLYRYKGEEELEHKFQKHSLDIFTDCFSKERFPIAGMDSASLAYLIGELNRKFKNYEQSIKWFQMALRDPQIKRKKLLENMVRDQWLLVTEEYKKVKQEKEEKENNLEHSEEVYLEEKKEEKANYEQDNNGDRRSKIRKKFFFRKAMQR